jgi:hypothetical protein
MYKILNNMTQFYTSCYYQRTGFFVIESKIDEPIEDHTKFVHENFITKLYKKTRALIITTGVKLCHII